MEMPWGMKYAWQFHHSLNVGLYKLFRQLLWHGIGHVPFFASKQLWNSSSEETLLRHWDLRHLHQVCACIGASESDGHHSSHKKTFWVTQCTLNTKTHHDWYLSSDRCTISNPKNTIILGLWCNSLIWQHWFTPWWTTHDMIHIYEWYDTSVHSFRNEWMNEWYKCYQVDSLQLWLWKK